MSRMPNEVNNEGKVFLHFLNSQVIRTVKTGMYGPFAVVIMPRASKYAGYTFNVKEERMHPYAQSKKMSFCVYGEDSEITLKKFVPETDADGKTVYREEKVKLGVAELQRELDAWKQDKAKEDIKKAAEEAENSKEESEFMENLSGAEEANLEL